MARVFEMAQLAAQVTGQAEVGVVADRGRLGSSALTVEHLALAPGYTYEWAAPAEPAGAETFLYVIRGTGTARVGEEAFGLEPEALVWLEPGESVQLKAAGDGLEALACRAPGMHESAA